MMEFLTGRVARKDPVSLVLDVHGVGYALAITVHTFDALPPEGEEATVLTHLHVREDAMQLFGFLQSEERQTFRRLQSISGIGVRTAMSILAGAQPAELKRRVAQGDVASLTRIPGIGKKTAERMIVELRDAFRKDGGDGGEGAGATPARNEALMALQALGYPAATAEKALSAMLSNLEQEEILGSAEMIKRALRILSG